MSTTIRYTECTGDQLRAIREALITGTLTVSFRKGCHFGPDFKRYNVTVQAPAGDPVWVGWVTGGDAGWTATKIDWREQSGPIVNGMPISMDRFSKRRSAADAIVWSVS